MTNSVFVELDAILDTRLAVVSSLNPEAGAKLAGSLAYYRRRSDDFSSITGIPHEEYKEAYAKRTSDILRSSVMTGIPRILSRLIGDLEYEKHVSPTNAALEVEVNMYPYDIEYHVQQRICDALAHYCGKETIIKPVDLPMEHLPATYFKERFGGMVFYNANDWLVAQFESMRGCPLPRLTLVAPALYQGPIPTDDELRIDPQSDPVDLFHFTEVLLGSFIHAEFAEPMLYSMFGRPPSHAT